MKHRVRVFGVKSETLRGVHGGDCDDRMVRLSVEHPVRAVARTDRRWPGLLGCRIHMIVGTPPLSVTGDVSNIVEDLRLGRFDIDCVAGRISHVLLLSG